jgi:integrase
MDGRRKRKSQKHAGVVLYSRSLPSGAIAWVARWIDPDSGRRKTETLPPVLTLEEQRTAWAARKAESLRDRTRCLAEGGPRKKNITIEGAVTRYFEDATYLRPKTRRAYRDSADELLEWARRRGLRLADDLRGEDLADFRATIVRRPKKNGDGGARKPSSVNKTLRSVGTILEHLRRLGLVPLLSSDTIRDSLPMLELPRPVPEPLRPAQLERIVAAMRRHDAEVFALTREEKEAGRAGGETRRHDPILPYFATVLLSGMRRDEARVLRWSAVELGDGPGSIVLSPEVVKTKHGRIVDLIVSPLLRDLLAALKLRSGGPHVFGGKEPLTQDVLKSTIKRLVREHECPPFSWKRLRVTCGTYLANAPGIFGAASAYREAKQLGHSVVVAEKHYLGVVRVDPAATTLEAAMGIEEQLREALDLTEERAAKRSG